MMNFCSVPYEADYGMYADSKMKSLSQYPMTMNPGQGMGQPMPVQPLNPPQMNLQMQMPSSMPPMSSYPMQGMPLGMMSGGGNGGMTPMSTMSTQLPIGAMTPLSSVTMMPMGNGSIDAPGINAVIPDLQSMSAMGQMQPMGQMQSMQQYGDGGSNMQMHQGRLTGSGGGAPSSPSQAGGWNSNPNSSGNNGYNMWQYTQPMQYQQQNHNQAQQQQQHQQQQHQQGQRMKSGYELQPVNYRDVRNGLNTPSMNESSSARFSKSTNSFNCGKTSSKVPHWR